MRHAIPVRLNLAITSAVVAFNALAFFALPALLPRAPWTAALLIPFLWVSNTQWGLIHEAIHKILHPDAETNERLGRLLSALLGASFYVLRFGHLMHHKLNRNWHSEIAAEQTFATRFLYYWHLLFGLYGSEVATGLLMALLPEGLFLALADRTLLKGYGEVRASGERFFYRRQQVRKVRIDTAAIVLLYGAAFVAYGRFWPVLALFIALRGFTLSFLDNIYHYATPADNSKAGKELTLSPLASALLLNSNYHETHHLNPLVPWAALPEMHAAQERRFDGDFVSHGLQQFAGPVLGISA